MKKFSALLRVICLVGGALGSGFVALPSWAQDAEKVQALQHVIDAQQQHIDAQQQQLDAQQKQLNAQKELLQQLQSQMQELVKDADTEMGAVAAEKPAVKPPVITDAEKSTAAVQPRPAKRPSYASKPLPEIGATLSQNFKHEQVSPTGANVLQQDPTLKLQIPDIDTVIGISGFAMLQVIHDTTGLDNCEFDTIGIPVDGAPSQTKFCVNPSRLAVSSQSGIKAGRFNTMLSIDFNGELDQPEPRLRVAYGELINDELDFAFLAGQTFGTMLDLRSVPETLDFAGPTGYVARRQPLARFTKLFGRSVLAEVAVETPENTSYIDADRRTRWPDFVIAGTWYVDGEYISHLRLAGLVRDLRAEGTDGSIESAVGWMINASGKLNLPFFDAKDNLKLAFQYGEGYGAQIKSGPDDAAFDINRSRLETIGVFSTYGGLQHWWTDNLRSNLVYGYVNANNPDFIDGDELENTTYVAADLIWNPYKKVTIGAEYLWGRRENQNGKDGTANRYLFSSRFDF